MKLYGICVEELDDTSSGGEYVDVIVTHAPKLSISFKAAQKYCEQLCVEKCKELNRNKHDKIRYDWGKNDYSEGDYYVEEVWDNNESCNCFLYKIVEFDY